VKKVLTWLVYVSLCFFSSISIAEVECNLDDCFVVAEKEAVPISTAKGLVINVTPFLGFTLDGVAKKITKISADLVIEIDDERKIVLTSISANELGLNSSDLTTYNLFKLAFLKDFNSLRSEGLTANELMAIKAFKVASSLSSAENFTYFLRKKMLVITYYDPQSEYFEAYILHENSPRIGQRISVVGFSKTEFRKLISTIKEL